MCRTWRPMGLSNLVTGIINLLFLGVTPISPFRGILNRVISPVRSGY